MGLITRKEVKKLVRSVPTELSIKDIRRVQENVLVYEGDKYYTWKNQIVEKYNKEMLWLPVKYLDLYQRETKKGKIKRKKLMDLDNQVYYVINESEVAKRIKEERR